MKMLGLGGQVNKKGQKGRGVKEAQSSAWVTVRMDIDVCQGSY